jgi:hypothetical protein
MGRTLRSRVVLDLDKDDIPELIDGGTTIETKMTLSSAIFTAPNPPMPVLSSLVTNLDQAQMVVKTTRAKGAVETRNVCRDLLWTALGSECSYVQVVCDQNPLNAANYAMLAGMRLAGVSKYQKPLIDASLTTTPGNVVVVANASQLLPPGNKKSTRRTYLWRATTNGGTSYIVGDPTPVAHTLFTGLPLNTTVAFQVAVKDSTGTSPWSQAVTVFVH